LAERPYRPEIRFRFRKIKRFIFGETMAIFLMTTGRSVHNLLLDAAPAIERMGGKVPPERDSGPFVHLSPGTCTRGMQNCKMHAIGHGLMAQRTFSTSPFSTTYGGAVPLPRELDPALAGAIQTAPSVYTDRYRR
jgi:hypothetical protein